MVPVVQLLHVPVPQMMDSVVEVLKILDKSLPDVEQVIEVPKIFQHPVLQCSSLQEPQNGGSVGDSADQTGHSAVCLHAFSCAAFGRPGGGSAADRASACRVFRWCGWVRLAAALWAYGGLVVEGGLLSHPVGPSTGVHRQARAVYKYWPWVIVDVPVIMLFVFQQSKSYVYCAAIQFIDRVPDLPVLPQKRDSTVQFLNKVVDAVVHDSCPWSRQCRAVAFIDKVVDISGSEQ